MARNGSDEQTAGIYVRGRPWRNAWLSLIAERRTTAGRLGLLGAHAGLIGGTCLPVALVAYEVSGPGSSTAVGAIIALPFYLPLFAFAGTAFVAVLAWGTALVLGGGEPPAESLATVRAFRASRWAGVALAALLALASVLSGR